MVDNPIINEIGRGGQAVVYKIEDSSGNKYAKKCLLNANDEYKSRFKREIRILSKISHRNIVPIINYDTTGENYSYTMPLAEGNLKQYLGHYGYGTSNINIYIDILKGMIKAHKEGIIHRDLNPNNVLLYLGDDENYYAAISDFGLGVFIERDTKSLTSTNVGMGTEYYFSPEQLKNAKAVDHRTDIYSLGVLLSEILTGYPYAVVSDNEIPKEYIHIIKKSCETDPFKRYQSIDELYQAIINIRDGSYDRPEDRLKKEIEILKGKPKSVLEGINNILNIFIVNSSDRSFYVDNLPQLDSRFLMMMVKGYSSKFETIFKQYDEYAEENMSFDYCDVIANFYFNVFNWTESYEIKSIIVKRLPIMGYGASRWHVGEVFARIFSKLDEPGLIQEVYELFKSNPSVANFCMSYCDGMSLSNRFNEFQ